MVRERRRVRRRVGRKEGRGINCIDEWGRGWREGGPQVWLGNGEAERKESDDVTTFGGGGGHWSTRGEGER